jgi:hypothetical protein
MKTNIEEKYGTVLSREEIKEAVDEFKFEKNTFIYGKMNEGMGRYLRKDGYDRVDICDRISRLNGKYAFMAENIKI